MDRSAALSKAATDIADITWAKFRHTYPKLRARRPKIIYNKRLKTCAGRAHLEDNFIDLSNDLVWEHGEEILMWVIPHELGHFVASEIFGHEGHGPDFKRVMTSIGCDPSTYHSFENSSHEARKRARIQA